jgi:hypothetical protein
MKEVLIIAVIRTVLEDQPLLMNCPAAGTMNSVFATDLS